MSLDTHDKHPLARGLLDSMWDLHFIRDAYNALLARGTIVPAAAAASRVVLVTAIAAIDRALKLGSSDPLACAWNASGSNQSKVDALGAALSARHVSIDDNCLQDLLALKYLRNAATHTDPPREEQRAFILSRHFPVNLALAQHEDWIRIQETFANVLHAIAEALGRDPCHGLGVAADVSDVADIACPDDPLRWLVRPADTLRFWQTELSVIAGIVSGGRVDSQKALEPALELWTECTRLAWQHEDASVMAAAGKLRSLIDAEKFPLVPPAGLVSFLLAFQGHTDLLGQSPIASYAKQVEPPLRRILQLRQSEWNETPWSPTVRADVARDMCAILLAHNETDDDCSDAIRLGAAAYTFCANRVPIDLFLKLAVDLPHRRAELLRHARQAFLVFALGRYWYAWVESPIHVPGCSPRYGRSALVQVTLTLVAELKCRLCELENESTA